MSDPLFEGPIWLIGCGNMAGAVLGRWLDAGLDPRAVTVIRPSGKPVADGISVLTAPPPDGAAPALVLLGMKPHQIDLVAPGLAPLLGRETLLVSILAGVELASLRRRFDRPAAIVRALPNTPVRLGRGVVALAAEGLDEAAGARLARLLAPLGLLEWVEEALFDVATALGGSGPAFLFRFVDTLAEAGAKAGLADDQALRMALACVRGAAELAATSGEDPRTLAARVTSPGGSTRKGLDVLDAPDGLAALMHATLDATVARNREMGAAAR